LHGRNFQRKAAMMRGAVHHKLWSDGINIGEGALK
jgi:hypothetical protein